MPQGTDRAALGALLRRPVEVPPHGVDLWWIPLGAGGRFVRFNGRVYEALTARRQKRPRYDLYHSALVVHVPEGRYVIENSWPIPDKAGAAARGVVVEGPVFTTRAGRLRALRYEVRCWRDGLIYDAKWAISEPQHLTNDLAQARRLLGFVPQVPAHVWGRTEPSTKEMWNSNSVISWLLARTGIPFDHVGPPDGGRAPGWNAGIAVAHAG